jgi:tol-pal system protein YbgF
MNRIFPFLFGLVFLAGCATQQDLNAVKWEVDALGTRLAKAEEKLKEKDRLTEQGLGQQAELQARYTEIQDQVASLQGKIDELKATTKTAVNEERVRALEKEIQNLKTLLEASKEPPKSLFDTGLEKYRAGRFSEALIDLKSFLSSNPDPSLVGDVQFWIGETLYSLGKYEDAILRYDTVVKKYSASDKVPDALLRQGMSFHKLGDDQTGNLVLQHLVQGYPASEAAAKAKKILKDGLGKGD